MSLSLFREVPLAIVYATIWCIVLWMAGYPADERVGVAVIAYIAFWVSRAVIGNVTLVLLKALRRYGLKTAEQAGIEISDNSEAKGSAGSNIVVTLILLSVLATVLGWALVPVTYIAPVVGLSQIGNAFAIAGLAMLAVGMFALALFFILSFALFTMTESMHKVRNLNDRINRIEESESLLQRLGTAPARA